MNLRQSVTAALALVSRRDRRILIVLIVIQAGLSFLDLVAIALLGIVVALSASAVTGETPKLVITVLDWLGLEKIDLLTLSLVLALIAATLLVSKSIISFLLTRRTLRFLANRQAIVIYSTEIQPGDRLHPDWWSKCCNIGRPWERCNDRFGVVACTYPHSWSCICGPRSHWIYHRVLCIGGAHASQSPRKLGWSTRYSGF